MAEAIRHYTVALQLHPRYVEAYFNLGVALARQGQFTKARQHVSEVLRLHTQPCRSASVARTWYAT